MNNYSPENIELLDKRIGKRMDLFRLVLVQAAEKTPLPEILEIFGNELTVKFLDIFAGVTIKVPPREVITNAARDTDIFLTVKAAAKPKDAYDEMAHRYDLEAWYVKKIFVEMDKLLSKHYQVLKVGK